ncbi:uncharacterized protein LOC113272162 [Papaver somniferum]|uniref:uncharacterized protein LOC113272162 n=1 Tax=Papaver somniferum TaxID=3469 RepID=UPI000E7033CD|nr:uncharacterized protein LOC113272162 [Papaver somniferum]
MEQTAWKIKSNTKWFQEGDRNTSFFISNAYARRRYNRIRQLYIGDELVPDREADFTEEEVLHAISDLANDKSPGPDGFPILFFQKCWRFIKEDIMSTIIEKVLATRLKLVMDKLISPVQCAYIEGRQIIDGTLIANELVDSRLIFGNPGIMCKIDLEKDFERINWRYLEFVLQQMGFSKKWRDWLRFCYSTSSFSVLINGSSFGYFTSTRGVRQDCPVSPLLFNIAMEGFSRFMDRAANLSLFSGFSVSSTSIILNHLHYADDTIFFVDINKEEMHNLFSALHCFEFIAGLKVNPSKTKLIVVRDVPNLPIWAEEFGCSTDYLPFMYLGMPLGAKSGSKVIWDPILENFDASLSVWRRISLSRGGREIAFWNDIWCGQFPLATVYPNMYKSSIDRNVKLADMISSDSNWKFDFKRVLHASEVEDYAALLTVIGDNPPARDGLPDTRRWRLNITGVFTVKYLYTKLVSEFGVDNFPYHFIWKSAVPPKINILIWSLIHGKLNTIDVLLHKGMNMYNSCALCEIGVESRDHLFIHCNIAYKIWCSLIPNIGWMWVLPSSIKILVEMWHHRLFASSGNYIWDLIPATIICTIWRERNCRLFESQYLYKIDDDLVHEAKSSVLAWAAAAGHHIHLNFSSSVLNTWDSIFM